MVTTDTTPFGALLRRYRLTAALSQEALAERAGLSADAVRALERGRRGAPRADTVARLTEALELAPDDRAALIAAARGQEVEPPATRSSALAAEASFRLDQPLPIGGFLGSLPAAGLVARQRELASALALLDEAQRGQGQTLLLAGEAGVGKTRLAQEVTLEARSRGFLIAAGRCYEAEQALPYYPFLDAMASAYSAAPASLREEAGERWPYLGALLPNHIPLPDVVGTQDEQQRVFFAVAAFLSALAGHVPAALLLDDLQWADSASLRLLLYLVRHLRSVPALMLGTYRDVGLARDHPLAGVMRELDREGLMTRIALRPLDPAGTGVLIGATIGEDRISEEFAELVHGRTEGNPFFVQQVVRALVEGGALFREDGHWSRKAVKEIEVPETVRSVVQQRIGRLSESTQGLLQEASVLGQTFGFDDLAGLNERAGGRDEEEMEQALDAAERLGIIRETGSDTYGFDHALTQQTLYGELPSRRRKRLHREAAEMLEELPARKRGRRTADLAWHFLQADEPGRALPYVVQAGDEAEAVFAHVEAERHYRTALRLAEESEDEAALMQVHEKLAAPLHRSGRYAEALEALERAAAGYECAGDLDGLVRVYAEIGGVHGNRGTTEEGMARLDSVLPRLAGANPSPELIYLHASHAALLFVLGRRDHHLAVTRQMVEMADGLDNARARAVARAQLGLALLNTGRREEGLPVLEEAMAYAEEAGDLATLAHALNNAAYVHELRGNFERSIPLFRRGFEISQRVGNPAQTAFMATALGRNAFLSGDWQRARQHAEEAVEISRALGASWVAPYPVLGLGRQLLPRGEWEGAERYVMEGYRLAEANADLQALETARLLLAELALWYGDFEAAEARLAEASVTATGDPRETRISAAMALSLSRALHGQGNTATARRILETTIERTRQSGELLAAAEGLRLLGMVAAVEGHLEEAERVLDEALTLSRETHYPYMEGQVLYEMGAIQGRRGEEEQVAELLSQAIAIFERLGARPYLEQSEAALVEHKAQ